MSGAVVLAPCQLRVQEAAANGVVTQNVRHLVDCLTRTRGVVDGARGAILQPGATPRGMPTSSDQIGEFELRAQAVIVTAGGIGGNHEMVRASWPARLGAAPHRMLSGVPAHVDGRMLGIVEAVGGTVINRDRMWHYVGEIQNWNPIRPDHGIRILPGPCSIWLD